MIKGKVQIVSLPPVGAEHIKPRFKIRDEYDIVEIGLGAMAILDDHNQIIWMNLEYLCVVQVGDVRIPTLEEFLKANPEKHPEARAKAAKDAADKAKREANEAALKADAKKAEQQTTENKTAGEAAKKTQSDEPAPE